MFKNQQNRQQITSNNSLDEFDIYSNNKQKLQNTSDSRLVLYFLCENIKKINNKHAQKIHAKKSYQKRTPHNLHKTRNFQQIILELSDWSDLYVSYPHVFTWERAKYQVRAILRYVCSRTQTNEEELFLCFQS